MLAAQEKFGLLMKWLDPDTETAGYKYEKIRQRLIRIFYGRGCFEAEDLADDTFDRVMQKLPQLSSEYIGEPALYFYGVANKIHLEWLRKQKKSAPSPQVFIANIELEEESEHEFDCLDSCLTKLPSDQRDLIVEYYQDEKRAKIQHRKSLAERLDITVNALQIKTSRIRSRLHSCVTECISEKSEERF